MARVVSFHYTLTDAAGKVIDCSSGRTPLSYMEGSGQIIPGLEKQMTGLKKGDKKVLRVPAAEAYGERNEKKLIKVLREQLPSREVQVGDQFTGGEEPHAPVFVVTHLTEKEATLDGNHPLAGIDLTFDVELIDMREATAEEVSHGHAHGEDGHSH
jgi:FKBP-type peptidyl-prolyl cis-trans isomerase SlyD